MADKQFIYVTGHNATGKTTLGLNIVKNEAVAGQGWFCIDGDDFVREHPDLNDEHVKVSQTNIMTLMRGGLNLDGLTEADRYEKVKEHNDEVRATWKPFFRKVFLRLLEVMAEKDMKKVIFPFHCWRDWTVDLIRECFGKDYKLKIVEVTVDPQLRYKRWVERQVGKGMDVDKRWREDAGEHMTKLRDLYGPEYKGNEEHFLKFVEQRYFFPRQPMPEGDKDVLVIKNDEFEGGVEFQKMLNSGIRAMAATGRLVFLSGTPGAGKTTTGEGLKRENGFAHFDGDVWCQGLTGFDPVEHSGLQATLEQMEAEPIEGVKSLYRACFDEYWEKKKRSESPDLAKAEAFYAAMAAEVLKRRNSELSGRDVVVTSTVIHREIRDFLRVQFGPEMEFVHLDVAPGLLASRVLGRIEKQAASDGKSLEEYVMASHHLFPPHMRTLEERMKGLTEDHSPPVETIAPDEQRTISITVTAEMDASAVLVEAQRCLKL